MYSGSGDQRRWAFPLALEEQAEKRGDETFVSMTNGESLTYRQLRDDAAKVAAMLAESGAKHGDRIAMMLPNGLDFLRAWAGIGRISATAVVLNTELTGDFLAHPLRDSTPSILIIHAEYLPRLDELGSSLASVGNLFVVGGQATEDEAFGRWMSFDAFEAPLPKASDLACIMYTSGTTGPPKGVLMPHAHCFLFGLGVVENCAVEPDDHYYVCLPLSHANGLLMQLGATLIAGASATIRERFSAGAWLDDLHQSGATITHTLGAISAFVIAQPASAKDCDHSLRLIVAAPNLVEHERLWRERFGVRDVLGGYGMTEVNIPLFGKLGEPRPGTCGRPYDRYFEVELRDPENDHPVPAGHVGEIMVRPRAAHCFMAGYLNLPEKTVQAWRNLWFHTGDAARLGADGYVTFVDRLKDCIRRRGENVSAADVERVLAELPDVAEVAAYGVPSAIPGGEEEIMCSIVLAAGAQPDTQTIAKHASAKMPRFAQPRYIDFVVSLPRTETEKIRKAELRSMGVTSTTIDLQTPGKRRTARID